MSNLKLNIILDKIRTGNRAPLGLTDGVLTNSNGSQPVTNDSVIPIILNYLKNYTSNDSLALQLQNYLTTANFNSIIASYPTLAVLNNTLANYVTTTALNSALANYPLQTRVTQQIADAIAPLVTSSSLNNLLLSYVTVNTFNTALARYTTTSDLNTILQAYSTVVATNNAINAAVAPLATAVSVSTLANNLANNYQNNVQLANTLSNYATVATVNNSFNQLSTLINTNTSDLTVVKNVLGTHFANNGPKIQDTYATITSLNTTNTNLINLGVTVSQNVSDITANRRDISNLQTLTSTQGTSLAALQKNVTDNQVILENSLTNVLGNNYTNGTPIANTYATIANLNITNARSLTNTTSINNINTVLGANITNNTTLANTYATITALAATNSTVATNGTNITNLQTGLATANTNITNLQTGLATTNANLSTANTNITNLQTGLTATNNNIVANYTPLTQFNLKTPYTYAPLPVVGGDDTLNLQTALTNGRGGIVYLQPNSTYNISAPLNISSNTVLDGNGSFIVLLPGSNCNMIRNIGQTTVTKTFSGASVTGNTFTASNVTSTDIGLAVTMSTGVGGVPWSSRVTSVSGTTATLAESSPTTATNVTISGYSVDSYITLKNIRFNRGSNGGTGTNVYSVLFRYIDSSEINTCYLWSTAGGSMISVANSVNFISFNLWFQCFGNGIHLSGFIRRALVKIVRGSVTNGSAVYLSTGEDITGNLARISIDDVYLTLAQNAISVINTGSSPTVYNTISDVFIKNVAGSTTGTSMILGNTVNTNAGGILNLSVSDFGITPSVGQNQLIVSGISNNYIFLNGITYQSNGLSIIGSLTTLQISNSQCTNSTVTTCISVPGQVTNISFSNISCQFVSNTSNVCTVTGSVSKLTIVNGIIDNVNNVVNLNGTSTTFFEFTNGNVTNSIYNVLINSSVNQSIKLMNCVLQATVAVIYMNGGSNQRVFSDNLGLLPLDNGTPTVYVGRSNLQVCRATGLINIDLAVVGNSVAGDTVLNTNSNIAAVGLVTFTGTFWRSLSNNTILSAPVQQSYVASTASTTNFSTLFNFSLAINGGTPTFYNNLSVTGTTQATFFSNLATVLQNAVGTANTTITQTVTANIVTIRIVVTNATSIVASFSSVGSDPNFVRYTGLVNGTAYSTNSNTLNVVGSQASTVPTSTQTSNAPITNTVIDTNGNLVSASKMTVGQTVLNGGGPISLTLPNTQATTVNQTILTDTSGNLSFGSPSLVYNNNGTIVPNRIVELFKTITTNSNGQATFTFPISLTSILMVSAIPQYPSGNNSSNAVGNVALQSISTTQATFIASYGTSVGLGGGNSTQFAQNMTIYCRITGYN